MIGGLGLALMHDQSRYHLLRRAGWCLLVLVGLLLAAILLR